MAKRKPKKIHYTINPDKAIGGEYRDEDGNPIAVGYVAYCDRDPYWSDPMEFPDAVSMVRLWDRMKLCPVKHRVAACYVASSGGRKAGQKTAKPRLPVDVLVTVPAQLPLAPLEEIAPTEEELAEIEAAEELVAAYL